MSILDFVQFDDESAVVVVDTMNSRGRECAKMLVLPHMGAVIAGRGRQEVFITLVLHAMVYQTFDAMAERLEEDFRDVTDGVPAYDNALAESLGLSAESLREQCLGNVEFVDIHEVLLVGPSARAGRLEAVWCRREGLNAPVTTLRSAGEIVAPPDDELIAAARQALATDAGACAFGALQLERCAKGKAGYGGRLLVARLGRNGVSVRDLGRLKE